MLWVLGSSASGFSPFHSLANSLTIRIRINA